MSDERLLLKVEEVAALLNIGRMTAYEMCWDEGSLKPITVRIGASKRGLRVSREGLERWIAENMGKLDAKDFRGGREDIPVQLRAVGGRR